jgi:hypothetical protein
MRKLLIAGLAVASLTGIAYAQAAQRNAESWTDAFSAKDRPTTCLDRNGIARKLGETTSAARIEFQCVQVWGDGLSGLSTGWLPVTPPTAAR